MAKQPLQRVLYVEDDPDIQMIARLALCELGGYEVASCSSGQEALDRVRDFSPQLMILDVMMPGMDGPATLAALRRLPGTATTPTVFMTAKVQPREVAHYRSLGAVDVISKPFDPMTLAADVARIWERQDG